MPTEDSKGDEDTKERLRRAEERLRMAVDAARFGVWYCDAPFHTLFLSPGLRDYLGVPIGTEYTLEIFYANVHDDDRAGVRQAIERSIQEGGNFEVECRCVRPKDGRLRWGRIVGRCFHDQNGKPQHLDGVIFDISRRKREEERMQRAEERLKLAMEAGDLAVWYCDAPFDKIVFSVGAYQHLGLPVGTEVSVELYYSFVHPDDREWVRQAFDRCVRQGLDTDLEFRTVRPSDGRIRWIRTIGRCFRDEDGRPHHFDGVTYDITHKKQEEEERERLLRELAEATRLRERLLGIVSHDLKSPLTVITGAAGLLQRAAGDKQRTLELNKRILNSADRMRRLINQLLDFARIAELGAMPVNFRPVDLHELCRHAIDELTVTQPNRTVSLEAQGDGRGMWDGDRLDEVLSNLLCNAVKYGEGPISVRVSDEGDAVTLAVHNQGPPIDAELLPYIFDPFHRGPGRDMAHLHSVGLGLFIVRQIVLAHGGEIDVQSPDGDGTTFTVRLPRRPDLRLRARPGHAEPGAPSLLQ